VNPRHALEAAGLQAFTSLARVQPWRASLRTGEWLGRLTHALGVRRRVAEDNLARAFPDRDAAWRAGVLREHYRELGRTTMEYARLPELADAPPGEVIAEVRGLEHLREAHARGAGCVVVTAHFGNFELAGAWIGRQVPLDFVYKPLRNPVTEAWIIRQRAQVGVGLISVRGGMRGILASLRAGRVVALLADQDAKRKGVFVPFLGRLASTYSGPATLALRAGVPLLFAVSDRGPDGRHTITFEPPLRIEEPAAPDAVERLTALHASRLEWWIHQRPAMWFWLHRRWKTRPPGEAPAEGG
jgi:KDO2-lipid IV(A) lauroyltransferase